MISVLKTVQLLPLQLAILQNKTKLAAVIGDSQGKHPRNNFLRIKTIPGVSEENITPVAEEIERRITKELSQEVNRTKSLILGAWLKVDEFLLHSQVRVQSGTAPGTSKNYDRENRECNEDRS